MPRSFVEPRCADLTLAEARDLAPLPVIARGPIQREMLELLARAHPNPLGQNRLCCPRSLKEAKARRPMSMRGTRWRGRCAMVPCRTVQTALVNGDDFAGLDLRVELQQEVCRTIRCWLLPPVFQRVLTDSWPHLADNWTGEWAAVDIRKLHDPAAGPKAGCSICARRTARASA